MTRAPRALLRPATAFLAVLVGLLAAFPFLGVHPARAATPAEIGAALRVDPVFNDPTAENALTEAQARSLRQRIEATGIPQYIAVLPQSAADAAGGPDALLVDLRDAVGRPGVYAVVAGNSFRARGTDVSVIAIADRAFAENRAAGPAAVLDAFVAGVGAAYGTSPSDPTAAGDPAPSSPGSIVPVLVFLLVAGGLVAGLVGWGIRRGRRRRAEWSARMREVLDEDVTALGERLGAFDVADPRLDDAGRGELATALDAYSAASDRAARLASPADVAATTEALDRGRYALACVEARLDGRPAPERRAPCFFDPRHGVSLEDVSWTPPGGIAHPVPACVECVATVGRGATPAAREVEIAGARRPYWEAGPDFAPYARGYFGGFGGTMAAAFTGTLIASALFPPVAMAAPAADAGAGGFGGGDFGGGGFGGGDFGGGGFGGGDFGGGDF